MKQLISWCAAWGAAAGLLTGQAAPADTPPGGGQGLSAALASEEYINFTFDGVGLPAFVKLVGEMTGRRFVLGEGVDGRITIVSPRVKHAEVYPLFVSILESVGCSVLQEGDTYRIVKLSERGSLMAPVVGPDEKVAGDGVITKIFRLNHVSASELRKALEARVSGGRTGALSAIDETNHLVVTDTAENIRRIQKLVEIIDQPGLTRATEVIPVKFASADALADELNKAIQNEAPKAEALQRRMPQIPGAVVETQAKPGVVASSHANSLLLVGTPSQIAELRKVIALMDVDTPTGRGRLNAIRLKYVSAEDTAKTLKGLLEGQVAVPGTPGAASAPRVRDRKIAIEADPANNALLVDASPGDFEIVRKVVEELDRVPEQVHIEVLIAEVTEGDGFRLGVDMTALDLPSDVGDTVVQGRSTLRDDPDTVLDAVQQGLLPGGLTVGVAQGTRIDAEGNVVVGYPGLINIDAVKEDSRIKIRSNPSLMAQNNMEASVNIVNQIPVTTSKIEGGSGTARDVIQNIDRVDVGIKLKITPHVIPGGEVRMDLNPSIEAVIDPGPSGQLFAPTIARREVSTTVTVRDGDMIVIAGLTREDTSKTVQRVPILGSIPLIGWLFQRRVEVNEKTNLLIFVTPRIVTDRQAAQAVIDRLSAQTGLKSDEGK